MIQVTCPNPACGKPAAVQDEFAGKQTTCPACGTIIAFPSLASVPAPQAASTPPAVQSGPAAPETPARPGRKVMAWTGLFGHAKTIALVSLVLGVISILAGLWTSLVPGELAADRPHMATRGMSAERAEEFARKFARAERAATPWMVTFLLVLGILMVLWGVIAIAAAIGVSNRRNWGRLLALALAGFASVLGLAGLVALFEGYFAYLAAVIAYLLFAAWLFLATAKSAWPKEAAPPQS
jgi:hypothetical protein